MPPRPLPTRLLLDTSSLTYRAFFALPTSIKGPHGRPINAVRGYLDMTARLIRDLAPVEVVHTFDHDWRPAPRVRAYPGYKSERREDPEELPQQFDVIREILAAVGQTRVEAPGWEADDAIGTLCHQVPDGEAVDVVTGDRDLLQLVHDDPPPVRVLFTVKGVSELAQFDEAGVLHKYGIPAQRYADYATLRGDPSDGLPGVRGVGEKTARSLVNTYPSLSELLDDADAQSPRLRTALRDARGYLTAMAEVVPVRTDVELVVARSERNDEKLDALVERYGIDGPVTRLREALDA